MGMGLTTPCSWVAGVHGMDACQCQRQGGECASGLQPCLSCLQLVQLVSRAAAAAGVPCAQPAPGATQTGVLDRSGCRIKCFAHRRAAPQPAVQRLYMAQMCCDRSWGILRAASASSLAKGRLKGAPWA